MAWAFSFQNKKIENVIGNEPSAYMVTSYAKLCALNKYNCLIWVEELYYWSTGGQLSVVEVSGFAILFNMTCFVLSNVQSTSLNITSLNRTFS